MTKNEIKAELQKQIIACMLNDFDSISDISIKLDSKYFSKPYNFYFNKIIQLSKQVKNKDDLILQLLLEKDVDRNILLQLKDLNLSLPQLQYRNTLEKFVEVKTSIEFEKVLQDYSKQLKDDVLVFELMNDLQCQIKESISQVEKFKIEKPFSLEEVANNIDNELQNKYHTSLSVETIPSMNFSSGGFKPSNLVGIAGSYKSGKTTLALNVIMDFISKNIPCGFFSLELSEEEIKKKIAGLLCNIPYENLREPRKMTEENRNKFLSMFSSKKELPLYISDTLMTETEIYNKTKFWKERFNIQAICIDYIGYIKTKKKFDIREREVSYYSNYLKQLAKELNIIVFAVAQLNRSGRFVPTVNNLAESIGLARDCDFLFLIYNPLDTGIKQMDRIIFNESHYILKLETTRHSKNGYKDILLSLNDNGRFKEIATEYDLNLSTFYPQQFNTTSKNIAGYKNYYEPAELETF